MLGTLKLPIRGDKFFEVVGGPFIECPDNMVGVKMAAEIKRPCHINIPTEDFSVPKLSELDVGLILAVQSIVRGQPVYVGCMAGRGRTGLFLAILAKAFGVEDPVGFVRKHYYRHAVETAAQKIFVSDYEVPAKVKRAIKIARFKSYFTFRTRLTNDTIALY